MEDVDSVDGVGGDPRYRAMSEHRVSMLGSPLRRAEDPEQSRDPKIRSLVEALRTVDYAPAPDPRFRAELRAQLVAVAPRIIAESAPAETERVANRPAPKPTATTRPTADEPAPVADLAAARRRRRFVRPLTIAASVAAAFLALLGGAVWMSQKALPGDALYGLKRASENVRLSFTSGADRGHEYLQLAQTRVEEAQALLQRSSASASGTGLSAGTVSSGTAQLIAANLASADSDLTHGTDLLDTSAVTSSSQAPITLIQAWAPGQLTRLQHLASALPDGSLQQRTRTSWALTDKALSRAKALAPAVAKGCASASHADALGPVPTCGATSSSAPVRTPGSAPAVGTQGPASVPARIVTPPATRAVTPSRASHTSPTATPTPAVPSSSSGLPPLLPTSGPVSVGSCGISVSLGPLGLGVGSCPTHS